MKVGIVQNSILYGGRLSVIVGIIEVLNRKGIIPDIITLRTEINSNHIQNKYSADIDFRIRIIHSHISKLPGEIEIIAFGLALHQVYKEYDYFIDSNNTSFLMPSRIPIFSYVHFPRIARLKSPFFSIHHPRGPRKTWADKKGAILKGLGLLYSFHSLKENNFITANSKFTLSHIRKHYPSFHNQIPVIYPPIATNHIPVVPFQRRKDIICSIGRFSEEKNQLAQIRIAKRLPYLQFHLIGFSEKNNGYLDFCKDYVNKNSIKNVHFHVNISFNEKYEILKIAKFFLHPNINEPFGIATVESIFAGCLPLVHNSGGQVEIVPLKELRFDVIDDIEDLLRCINRADEYNNSIQKELVHHCQTSFSADVFKKKIRKHIKYFESKYF